MDMTLYILGVVVAFGDPLFYSICNIDEDAMPSLSIYQKLKLMIHQWSLKKLC